MSAIPSTMRSTVIKAFMPAGAQASSAYLNLEQVPVPLVNSSDVLIKVAAASINPADYKILQGYFAIVHKLPMTCGLDFAGTVVKTGSDVSRLKVGDRVFGYCHYKTMAAFGEYCSVDQQYVSNIPANVSFAEAATLPVAAMTSYQGLFEHGQLKKGQKVLILGGSGGCGIYGLQLAKRVGEASVVATTCSGRNEALVKEHGADVVINYQEKKWWEELKGQNYDVIYDTVGGAESWEHAAEVLKPNGAFVTIAGDNQQPLTVGRMASTAAYTINRKFWSMFGNPTYHFFRCDCNVKCLNAVGKAMADGHLKAVIEKTFPLEQVIDMYNQIMSGRTRGKLVLAVTEEGAAKAEEEKKAN